MKKIKAINDKIEQNKSQYYLDRQTAKISVLASRNVSKYGFLTGKDVLAERDLLERSAIMKRFEYSRFGNELKTQIDIAKKQYQGLDKFLNLMKKKNQYLKSIIIQI